MSKRSSLGKGLGILLGGEERPEETAASGKTAGRKPANAEGTPSREKSAKKEDASKDKPAARTGTAAKKEKTAPANGRYEVSLALIDPNGDQPRTVFEETSLEELAESIRQHGVIQPLVVTKKDERYIIIAGERRYRAAKMAGLRTVPVVIGDYTDQQKMEISLIENIQRADLNPVEEALAYQKLITEFKLRQEDVAARVSKNRATITNSMRLLKLDPKVLEMVADGRISAGHARALLGLKEGEAQFALAGKIVEKELSVRETEKLVKKLTEEKEAPVQKEAEETEEDRLAIFYHELEENLKKAMGTKVSIRRRENGQGKIEIDYYSQEELERITELLQSMR